MKNVIIAIVVIIAIFGAWKLLFSGVDRTKPEVVARAFIVALKNHNIDKASKFWLPDSAEAWKTAATEKLNSMQTGTMSRFYEELADGSTPFTMMANSDSVPNEQTMSSGNTNLGVRKIDGKWYVFRAPL